MFRGKVWRFPTANEQARHCAQASGESGATRKTQKEKPRAEDRGGGETGGLVHSLVIKKIMIKVSQGLIYLIMSQINVASSVVQSNTRKTVSSSTKTT